MAAVTRNDLNSGVLQSWISRQVLANFEPNLYFHKMGKRPDTPSGYNTIGWAKFTQLAASAVTAGTTSTDGTTPDDTAFNATVITTTPVQYRIVVTLSDMLIELNVVNFLKGAAVEVGSAMARKIDAVIQTTIMAGDNVIYGGAKTARTALGNDSILTAQLLNRASAKLESYYAPKIDGFYVAFIHSYQLYDLRSETGAGNWLEVNKYARPEQIFKGEIGMLNGVRVILAPHIQTFSSTVTVYPVLVIGGGAYGVAEFQTLRTYVTPAATSDSDPLAQRRKVGAKIAFATKILQQNSMIRIETGATQI